MYIFLNDLKCQHSIVRITLKNCFYYLITFNGKHINLSIINNFILEIK